MAQIKKEFLIDNLVESGFLFKEDDSKFVIMEKPIEGFFYLKRRIAVSNDGGIIYLGIAISKDMTISTGLELMKISKVLLSDQEFVDNLRLKAEAL